MVLSACDEAGESDMCRQHASAAACEAAPSEAGCDWVSIAFFPEGSERLRWPTTRRIESGLILPRRMDAAIYEPVLCTILQGSKETVAGDMQVSIGAGESLSVSHDVPVVSRITSARKGSPYLAVIFSLDVAMLRSLYDEVGGENIGHGEPSAMSVHETDPNVADADTSG